MSTITARARRWLAVGAVVPLTLALSVVPRPMTGPAGASELGTHPVAAALPPLISNRLVGVTSDDGLWIRDPVLADVSWTRIDDGNTATGVAYLYGFLWSTTADDRLWYRDIATAAEVVWAPWGTTDHRVVALTATSSELWAVTAEGRLQVIDPTHQTSWTDVGPAAPGTTAITALGSRIWATTSSNTLRYRSTALQASSWQTAGHANGVVALTDIGGRLWARTSDDLLWVRSSSTSDVLWSHVGHAIGVTEMTAVP